MDFCAVYAYVTTRVDPVNQSCQSTNNSGIYSLAQTNIMLRAANSYLNDLWSSYDDLQFLNMKYFCTCKSWQCPCTHHNYYCNSLFVSLLCLLFRPFRSRQMSYSKKHCRYYMKNFHFYSIQWGLMLLLHFDTVRQYERAGSQMYHLRQLAHNSWELFWTVTDDREFWLSNQQSDLESAKKSRKISND